MIISLKSRAAEAPLGPAFQVPHFFKRYADRIALAVAIVSVAAIAVIH